jgi:2-keto-4-pentenoate hydratase/2-oxohepta-3-ene-1,7-dioic acid hydratase in catechol pathway
MKIARYLAHGQVSYGAVEGDSVKELSASPFESFTITDHTHKISEVKLLAPSEPSKILAIGLNYSSHLHDRPAPTEPMVFYKTPTSLIGPGETIIRPKDTNKLDAEGELVIVMKDRCRNVARDDALNHVLGYTCGNDVSARDWQRDDRNWWRAKSADTFSPAGPYIETELDPHNIRLSARINGKEVQGESTTYLIFDIPSIIEYTSRFVTLEPGDLIYTGTPGEPGEMKDGDVCEVEIEGIGVLSNPIKLES